MKPKHHEIISPVLKSVESYGIDFYDALSNPEILKALNKANDQYLHWEELRYKDWIPKSFKDKEAFWALLRLKRYSESIKTPIRDKSGEFFRICTRNYAEFLHTVDKEMAGNFMGIPAHLTEDNKKQFISRNLIEESISSSQLEGANTSRAVAKKMLIEGRRPNNESEQMIVNNYQAMQKIEQDFYRQDLSLSLLNELHSIITHNTLSEKHQGKLRETFDEKGERLKVIPPRSNMIAYIAPDKEFVEQELIKLIDFANNNTSDSEFIHPLIKGIMLHFWIGLLHPYEDGNGRLARILFYWYMLKNEYWAFKYLSVSEKIKKSPKQYAMAYIYSEQDSCDLTYFIHYHIEKLKLTRKDFQKYVENKISENRTINFEKQEKYQLNNRQVKLLHYFYKNREERTNITAYETLHDVKKLTAIMDLNDLIKKEFLIKRKIGRHTYYHPTKKVDDFFK